jgi:hypothetical protein
MGWLLSDSFQFTSKPIQGTSQQQQLLRAELKNSNPHISMNNRSQETPKVSMESLFPVDKGYEETTKKE